MLPEQITQKQETIANLYALRSGLSIMSEIRDTTDELLEKTEELRKSIEEKEEEINAIKRTENAKKDNYLNKIRAAGNSIQASKQKIANSKNDVKEKIRGETYNYTPCIFLSILCFALSYVFGLLIFISVPMFIGAIGYLGTRYNKKSKNPKVCPAGKKLYPKFNLICGSISLPIAIISFISFIIMLWVLIQPESAPIKAEALAALVPSFMTDIVRELFGPVILMVVISALICAPAIIITICCFINQRKLKNAIKKIQEDSDNEIALERKHIESKSKFIASSNENLEKVFKEYEQATHNEILLCENNIGELQSELDATNVELDLSNAKFESVYKATQNQFCEMFDERDWGNLDLVIFNYETGRARDLRDALIQVDNERRNERLIDAVNNASLAISKSISRGFGQMSRMIEDKFDRLDASISHLAGSINDYSAKSELQNNAMRSALGELSAISSAQEALQRKMSTSSDQMANDIAYMRELTHRTYYNV